MATVITRACMVLPLVCRVSIGGRSSLCLIPGIAPLVFPFLPCVRRFHLIGIFSHKMSHSPLQAEHPQESVAGSPDAISCRRYGRRRKGHNAGYAEHLRHVSSPRRFAAQCSAVGKTTYPAVVVEFLDNAVPCLRESGHLPIKLWDVEKNSETWTRSTCRGDYSTGKNHRPVHKLTMMFVEASTIS